MCNSDVQMILEIIITLLELVRFFVPVVLIIFCTIDIFKIIVSKKEDEIKKLRKDVIMKIFYSIIIFLIPTIVPFILNLVDSFIPLEYDNTWKTCWDYVKENKKNS